MAPERLSRLQRRILTWLAAKEARTQGTMAANHPALVRALAHDKGHLSASLKGLVTITRMPGGKAEAVDLTAEGRERAEVVNNEDGQTGRHCVVALDDVTATALQDHAARHGRTPATQNRIFLREYLARMGAGMVLLLALMTPAWAGAVRCTTYEVKSLGRLETLCDDGTRAVHTWNKTLSRWESLVTPPPGKACTGRLNKAGQWERRC